MSRVYVKNLPKNVNEEGIRKHFGEIGQINDVNLKYKNGIFRGFGFIGYETTEMAEEACKILNNTFIKKFKISVEPAKNFTNEAILKTGNKKRNFESVPEKWDETNLAKLRLSMTKIKNSKVNKGLRKQMIHEFLNPLLPKKVYIPRKMKFLAYIAFESRKELLQAIQKDKSFIGGNRVNISEVTKESLHDNSCEGLSPWHMAEKKMDDAKPVAETAKIFIRNLPYTLTEEELKSFFEKIGPIRGLSLPICKETLKPKGFAHIAFMFPEHAVKALNMDGTDLKGRIIHILPSNREEEEEIESVPFKKKKVVERKKLASSWHNWNMLFLGANPVMKKAAKSSNTTKLNMLEDRDINLATTLAIEETHIVRDTKQFLEDNGVSLDAFSNPGMERSCTVILAKNLPENTTAEELQERFAKFGEINRIILPEHGLTAIIEFVYQDHAATAIKKLAYRQFKHLPLYLEWAPIKVFHKAENNSKDTKTEPPEQDNEGNNSSKETLPDIKNNSHIEPEQNATLYIKNINFDTTEETLKEYFSSCGNVHSATITKQKGLSKGFGFVQYYNSKAAKSAHLKFQRSNLDGHQLIVQMAKNFTPNEISQRRPKQDLGKKTTSKIIVKNLPFQATVKEIIDLFKPFGVLRNVRLPPKHGQSGEHRGFGFVDFSTIEDAERAFEQLSASTHLYGRRLVLQWAKEDETIDELRQRTAETFMASGQPARKKLKLCDEEDENAFFY